MIGTAWRAARALGHREGGRIGRFAGAGAIATCVDFTLFSVLVFGAGMAPVPANITAFAVAVLVSYGLNRFWTFRTPAAGRSAVARAVRFFGYNVLSATLATAVLWALIRLTVPPLAAKVLSIGVSMTFNYLTMSQLVFRSSGANGAQRNP